MMTETPNLRVRPGSNGLKAWEVENAHREAHRRVCGREGRDNIPAVDAAVKREALEVLWEMQHERAVAEFAAGTHLRASAFVRGYKAECAVSEAMGKEPQEFGAFCRDFVAHDLMSREADDYYDGADRED